MNHKAVRTFIRLLLKESKRSLERNDVYNKALRAGVKMNSAMQALFECPVNSRVWFKEEAKPYRVRARSGRYLVCTKPHNPLRTVLYTVVDLQAGVRGTENLIFCAGAETDKDCWEMIARLTDHVDPSGVSRRNQLPLRVEQVKRGSP